MSSLSCRCLFHQGYFPFAPVHLLLCLRLGCLPCCMGFGFDFLGFCLDGLRFHLCFRLCRSSFSFGFGIIFSCLCFQSLGFGLGLGLECSCLLLGFGFHLCCLCLALSFELGGFGLCISLCLGKSSLTFSLQLCSLGLRLFGSSLAGSLIIKAGY